MHDKTIIRIEVSTFAEIIEAPMTFDLYSHDGSIDKEIPFDEDMLAKMDGKTVKYFYYRKTDDGQIELLNEAGKQNW